MIKRVSFEATEFGSLPNRLEAGTPPIAEVIGLGAAITFYKPSLRSKFKPMKPSLTIYNANYAHSVKCTYTAPLMTISRVVAFNLADEHHQDVGIY
ncbi:Probable cysteine desulfurase [Shewanella morhuae]|uniref:Probable cysteine desulfurase n=1 Tax=Shewanella morhuae TaxID=365591 RepID=A0A380C8M9_9GAMM|nr:Probable cysteine desulfurase [Shewanella morhuae]